MVHIFHWLVIFVAEKPQNQFRFSFTNPTLIYQISVHIHLLFVLVHIHYVTEQVQIKYTIYGFSYHSDAIEYQHWTDSVHIWSVFYHWRIWCCSIEGEEYIDEWRNPRTGAVTYYCSLCGCQFDSKLIVTHAKGQGHQQQYKVWCFFGNGPLFRRSTIPEVHCADRCHSAIVWVKVGVRIRIRVRVSLRVRLRVSGNSRLSE